MIIFFIATMLRKILHNKIVLGLIGALILGGAIGLVSLQNSQKLQTALDFDFYLKKPEISIDQTYNNYLQFGWTANSQDSISQYQLLYVTAEPMNRSDIIDMYERNDVKLGKCTFTTPEKNVRSSECGYNYFYSHDGAYNIVSMKPPIVNGNYALVYFTQFGEVSEISEVVHVPSQGAAYINYDYNNSHSNTYIEEQQRGFMEFDNALQKIQNFDMSVYTSYSIATWDSPRRGASSYILSLEYDPYTSQADMEYNVKNFGADLTCYIDGNTSTNSYSRNELCYHEWFRIGRNQGEQNVALFPNLESSGAYAMTYTVPGSSKSAPLSTIKNLYNDRFITSYEYPNEFDFRTDEVNNNLIFQWREVNDDINGAYEIIWVTGEVLDSIQMDRKIQNKSKFGKCTFSVDGISGGCAAELLINSIGRMTNITLTKPVKNSTYAIRYKNKYYETPATDYFSYYTYVPSETPVSTPSEIYNAPLPEINFNDFPPLDFSDLPIDAWYTPYLEQLVHEEIMSGDSGSNRIRPLDPLNRAEAVKIIARLSGVYIDTTPSSTQFFCDIPSYSWYAPYVYHMYLNGSMQGYTDYSCEAGRSFRADQNLTRAEALKLLYANFGLIPPIPQYEDQFLFYDVNNTDWFGPYVIDAYKNEVLRGYGDGLFRPNGQITRAEMAKIATLVRQLADKQAMINR